MPASIRSDDLRLVVDGGTPLAVAAGKGVALAKKDSLDAKKPAPRKDLLVGEWRITRSEHLGRPRPELPEDAMLVFTAKEVSIKAGPGGITRRYQIDDKKTPAAIDLSGDDGTWPGIYKLDGDGLILCVRLRPGSRPTEFISFASDEDLMVFRCSRAGSVPDKTEKDKSEAKKPAPNAVALSDLKITKTNFTPPSVEFTVRLDLAGGTLLEAWASVGIKDAGKTLDVFAGAIHRGLLSANGIDFANPAPSLKAQRVTMRKKANTENIYECSVRYPELVLDNPETEFAIVAAARKGTEIVRTNAASVRVNLKTGELLPNGK